MGDGGDYPLHGEKLTFCGPQIISKNKEKTEKNCGGKLERRGEVSNRGDGKF